MANKTKAALADALRSIMKEKPIDKITIKDLVDNCGVNRQTFYYHFNDVYDLLEWVFEDDAEKVLPTSITYDHWQDDVLRFYEYLRDNKDFALNVYHSKSRMNLLEFYKRKIEECIRKFLDSVIDGHCVSSQDYEFIVEFYSNGLVGLISQWLDLNMELPKCVSRERFIKILSCSVENIISRFEVK